MEEVTVVVILQLNIDSAHNQTADTNSIPYYTQKGGNHQPLKEKRNVRRLYSSTQTSKPYLTYRKFVLYLVARALKSPERKITPPHHKPKVLVEQWQIISGTWRYISSSGRISSNIGSPIIGRITSSITLLHSQFLLFSASWINYVSISYSETWTQNLNC